MSYLLTPHPISVKFINCLKLKLLEDEKLEDKNKKFYVNLSLGFALSLFAYIAAYEFSHVVFEGKNYIASVNGKYITVPELKERMKNAEKQYTTQMGIDFKTENGKKTFFDLKKQVMQDLILTKIMMQNAAEQNILITDEMVNQEIDKIKAQSFQNNQLEYEKALRKNDLTEEDLKKIIKEKITFQKFTEKLFEENIKIPEKELKDAYESKKSEFATKEMVEASHILVSSESKAKEIKTELDKGAKFEELANKYSMDPGSKSNGGQLGFFARGAMVPGFDKASFELKVGEISQPIKTNFGFHIIKKTGYKPAKVSSFEEVKVNLEQQLKVEKQKAFFTEWKEKVMKEADIKYNKSYEGFSIAEKKEEAPALPSAEQNSGTPEDPQSKAENSAEHDGD